MTKKLMNTIAVLEEKAGKNWIEEFKIVTTEEELIEKANKFGIELTPEVAKEGLSILRNDSSSELSDDDLSGIAGGKIAII